MICRDRSFLRGMPRRFPTTRGIFFYRLVRLRARRRIFRNGQGLCVRSRGVMVAHRGDGKLHDAPESTVFPTPKELRGRIS